MIINIGAWLILPQGINVRSGSSTVVKEDSRTVAALVTPISTKLKFGDGRDKIDGNSSVSSTIRGEKLFHTDNEGVTAAEEQAQQETG